MVFVCSQYRAIHCEVIDQMDTETFLMAFSRFVHRRNRPKRVRSDRGGNFVKGHRVINEVLAALKKE